MDIVKHLKRQLQVPWFLDSDDDESYFEAKYSAANRTMSIELAVVSLIPTCRSGCSGDSDCIGACDDKPQWQIIELTFEDCWGFRSSHCTQLSLNRVFDDNNDLLFGEGFYVRKDRSSLLDALYHAITNGGFSPFVIAAHGLSDATTNARLGAFVAGLSAFVIASGDQFIEIIAHSWSWKFVREIG